MRNFYRVNKVKFNVKYASVFSLLLVTMNVGRVIDEVFIKKRKEYMYNHRSVSRAVIGQTYQTRAIVTYDNIFSLCSGCYIFWYIVVAIKYKADTKQQITAKERELRKCRKIYYGAHYILPFLCVYPSVKMFAACALLCIFLIVHILFAAYSTKIVSGMYFPTPFPPYNPLGNTYCAFWWWEVW